MPTRKSHNRKIKNSDGTRTVRVKRHHVKTRRKKGW